jgi:CHASE2 domain-containing sensor protein/signal transduction histidine kinase
MRRRPRVMKSREAASLTRRVVLREWITILVVMLALAVLLGAQNGLGRLDQTLYDQFVGANTRPARDDIIIVAIDDYSLAQLGRWPWPRQLHASLIDKIAAAHPRIIGLDVILTEPEQPRADGKRPGDDALHEALLHNRLTVLPLVTANTGAGIGALPPIPELADAAWAIGHINLQHDSDGVVRSVFLHEGPGSDGGKWWPHFALALSDPQYAKHAADRPMPMPVQDASELYEQGAAAQKGWQRIDRMYIPYAGNNGHFQTVPYISVLRGEVPAQFFKDKHVLIGATALGMADAYPTPVSGASGAMPGIEIHANILAALLDRQSIVPARPWQTAAFSALPVLLALVAYLLLAPRVALMINGALLLLTIASSYAALRAGYWIAPAAALIVLAISYPLWSWRRLEAAIAYLGQEFMRLDQEPHLLPEDADEPEHIEDVLERRINAMKRAARRVRDLRQFVSDSLDSLPDATLVTTADGRILLPNRLAHIYFAAQGVALADGTSLIEALSALKSPQPIDHVDASSFRWKDLLDPERAEMLTSGVAATDERGRDMLVKSAPCYSAAYALTGWIISVIDISTIRAAERSRDETLRFLSHDMRAPQASILALLELQSDPVSAVPQEEFFARIEKASRRTLGLADNFVQLARAQSQEYRFEEVDFQDMLFDATDEMWTLAHGKNIRIETDVASGAAAADFPVRADRTLMTRALVNLLSNAINYSPGNTTITCTLRHPIGLPPEYVYCSIGDQGYGIAPQDRAKLFQRFVRVSRPGQPRHEGIGLGLVFVKTVVERHHGQLDFSSEVGEGTTFTIVLPGLRPEKMA